MTASELKERMDQGQPITLVDVRDAHEREIADLPDYGQLRIPLGDVEEAAPNLDPDHPVVLYCRSGSRSGWATRRLLAQGYGNIWNLKGGLLAWKEEVDPSIQEY